MFGGLDVGLYVKWWLGRTYFGGVYLGVYERWWPSGIHVGGFCVGLYVWWWLGGIGFGGFHVGLYVSVGLMVYRLLFRFQFVCNVVACWYLVLLVSCLACM